MDILYALRTHTMQTGGDTENYDAASIANQIQSCELWGIWNDINRKGYVKRRAVNLSLCFILNLIPYIYSASFSPFITEILRWNHITCDNVYRGQWLFWFGKIVYINALCIWHFFSAAKFVYAVLSTIQSHRPFLFIYTFDYV